MTTLTHADRAWLDQEDRRTVQIIRRNGVYIQYVFGDSTDRRPPFAYSVGLFGIGHPELLIIGTSDATASAVINDLASRVRAGDDLTVGEVVTFDGWSHRVRVEEVPNAGEIAFAANRFYKRPAAFSVPLLQLTYDDKAGRFPGEDGYANPAWVQPRPGAFRA